jgi:hypothetical protein
MRHGREIITHKAIPNMVPRRIRTDRSRGDVGHDSATTGWLTIFASETQEPYRAFGIVVLTGRHPPSPRARPANTGRNRLFAGCASLFLISFFNGLPEALTMRAAFYQCRHAKEKAMN